MTEREFENMVREHRSTIYTVCYMFSADKDEVADLFDDSTEDTRQIGLLRERISKLGPFDRAIILLWLENLSYEEIGQIVGITPSNVSVRLVRIKEQLKKM